MIGWTRSTGQAWKQWKKILHFEDDRLLARMLFSKFRAERFRYVNYEHPAPDPVRIVLDEQPDLILMDVVMPKLSGFDATRRLTGDPRTRAIPILIISISGQPEEIREGMRSGATDYLVSVKYHPSDIVELARRFIRNPRAYRPRYREELERAERQAGERR